MNYELYYVVTNFQSKSTVQLNFMHAIINEMFQNHQIVLQHSKKLLFAQSILWFSFFWKSKLLKWVIEGIFLVYRRYVCWFCWNSFLFLVCLKRDCRKRAFFFRHELADWHTSEACVGDVRNRCTENSKKLEAVAFYHFGTLQLLLLKCKQTPKWKKQRQSRLLVSARNKICFLFALTFTAVLLSSEKMTETC